MINKMIEKQEDFADFFKRIHVLEHGLREKCAELMKPGTNAYMTDLFVLGGVKRTLAVSAGFCEMMRTKNFTCAAALLRMQIDTAGRLYALSYVPDSDKIVRNIADGERFNKQKDEKNNYLKDFYIIERLDEIFPWVKNVYEESSDFIHLSGRHMYSTVSGIDNETKSVNFDISATDLPKNKDEYSEVLEAFFETTEIILLLIQSYVSSRVS
jgi:hypothetical protein